MTKEILVIKGKSQSQDSVDRVTAKLLRRLEKIGLDYHLAEQQNSGSNFSLELNYLLKEHQPRILVSVGYSLSVHISKEYPQKKPLVSVLPDIPGTADSIYDSAKKNLESIAAVADQILVVDEPSRAILEYQIAGMSGRVQLVRQVDALKRLLDDLCELPRANQKILISSHDFRFIADTVHMLQRIPGIEVRLQNWPLSSSVPPSNTYSDIAWADTVLCEWAGRNAVWYSNNLSASKRLLVRLHGFEGRSEWIKNLNMSSVEKILTVSAFYKHQLLARHNWNSSQVEVIGNSINYDSLNRPKTSAAEFHLGMLGFTPLLKRPHIAIEILRLLVQKDSRFILHLRGESPWNHSWVWRQNVTEVDAYQQLYKLIAGDSLLRSHVVFESPGANVEAWFSKIGWILSLSERETFHLAAAEGMASGAIPVFMPREGIEEIFTDRWLFDTPEEIANFIYSTVTQQIWLKESLRASQYAHRFDFAQVSKKWREVILND